MTRAVVSADIGLGFMDLKCLFDAVRSAVVTPKNDVFSQQSPRNRQRMPGEELSRQNHALDDCFNLHGDAPFQPSPIAYFQSCFYSRKACRAKRPALVIWPLRRHAGPSGAARFARF